jgi:hypothetical protein
MLRCGSFSADWKKVLSEGLVMAASKLGIVGYPLARSNTDSALGGESAERAGSSVRGVATALKAGTGPTR